MTGPTPKVGGRWPVVAQDGRCGTRACISGPVATVMDLHAITKEFMAVFEEGDELNMGVPLKSITFMQMAISSSS
jgi:hypothetical protein